MPASKDELIDVAFAELRAEIDASGYGGFVKDEMLRNAAEKIVFKVLARIAETKDTPPAREI